jgi:hypothetical protein
MFMKIASQIAMTIVSATILMDCGASEICIGKILSEDTITNDVVQSAFPGATSETMVPLSQFLSAASSDGFPAFFYSSIPDRYANDTTVLDEYDEMAKTNHNLTAWSTKDGHTPNAFTNLLITAKEKWGWTNRVEAAKAVGAFHIHYLKNRLDLLASIISEIPYSNNYRNIIADSYLRELKIWFRKHGMSFVTKDGVNPLKAYMDDLSAALDAPRLGNINELMAKIDRPDVVFDMSFLPTDEWVNETMSKVLIDDIPFESVKNVLRLCLGVEEYNKFVDIYNNGVTNP